MVQLSATRCSYIAILWVSLVSFAAITLCVASQRVFIVVIVYFVTTQVRKLLDTPSYVMQVMHGAGHFWTSWWTVYCPCNILYHGAHAGGHHLYMWMGHSELTHQHVGLGRRWPDIWSIIPVFYSFFHCYFIIEFLPPSVYVLFVFLLYFSFLCFSLPCIPLYLPHSTISFMLVFLFPFSLCFCSPFYFPFPLS
jgi:hypothetical protein